MSNIDNQNFANEILHKFTSSSWNAIYLPKIPQEHHQVCKFIFKITGDNYPQLKKETDEILIEIGKIYSRIETEIIPQNEANRIMLECVDRSLIKLKVPRTFNHRIECAKGFFSGSFEEEQFTNWLKNQYLKDTNVYLGREVCSHLLDRLNCLDKEIEILSPTLHPDLKELKDKLEKVWKKIPIFF